MVMEAMRMSEDNVSECPIIEEETNVNATRFFDLLKDSNELLWDGCTNHSKLLIVAQVFTIKSNHRLSEAGYDKIIEWARSILPEGNKLKENFYIAKSMMKPHSLGYQKIDMCPNFCMLYHHENFELPKCMTYGHSCSKPRTGRGKTLVAYVATQFLTYVLIIFKNKKIRVYMWRQHRTSGLILKKQYVKEIITESYIITAI
jgi:hypothetical protein